MGIPLAIAEPTGMCRRFLRRYRSGDLQSCAAGGYCDASVMLGDVPCEEKAAAGDNWPHDDPAWPQQCARCDYRFTEQDNWQRNEPRVYRLADGSEVSWWGTPDDSVPAGTMVRADWYDEYSGRGDSWLVVLPDKGIWISTQQATDGGYWTVSGSPPAISVTPSIWHNAPHGWHGFITNGELV